MSSEIIIGSASDEEGKQDYFEEKKARARKNLQCYPNLQKALKDFDYLNSDNHIKNAFFNIASYNNCESLLNNFEKVLGYVLSLPKQKRNQIFSRICNTGENTFKLCNEFTFYSELLKNDFISEIFYEDSTIGNHDFKIIIDNTEINVEVTSLGETPLEERIKEGFNLACNEILMEFPDKTSLQLTLILDRIPLNEDSSPEQIKEVILKDYKSIKEIILIKPRGIAFLENLGNPEKKIIEFKELFQYYHEFGERLNLLLNSNEEILRNLKNLDIINNSIRSFIIGPAKYKLIEIHSECNSWVESEKLRKKSLVSQIQRNLKQKIQKKQLENKKNPFIAFHFDDFAFMNYWDKTDPFSRQSLGELKELIYSIFREEKEKEILGILLYEKNLRNSTFIKNPLVGQIESDILHKINLISS